MIILIGITVLGIIIFLAYKNIVTLPHGRVEFKTGLVLKMLPKSNGEVDLFKLRNEYDRMGKLGSKGLSRVITEKALTISTRHGDINAMAFINPEAKDKPLILYFHAGGWCIGSINSHRESCVRTSMASGMTVLAVDYSLAPEYPFPRCVEECIDVLSWILESADFDFADTKRVILMGESARGNMSIVLAHDRLLKDGAHEILEVIPIYAVTDCTKEKAGSFEDFSEGYYLTKETMEAFEKAYIDGEVDRNHPWLSPLLQDDLKGFPDTYIITAEFDPLRDEGEAFGHKLQSLGTNVVIKRYSGVIHDFYGRKLFGKKGLKAAKELGSYLSEKYAS